MEVSYLGLKVERYGTPNDSLYIIGMGLAGAIPVAGDWNGSGKTKTGVFVHELYWYVD